ncbi:MAG TPA: zinc-dependent peptidase [Bacteroidia bacterium]|nr:zinc-dependent peptidase [Bacteroidia bacterium]
MIGFIVLFIGYFTIVYLVRNTHNLALFVVSNEQKRELHEYFKNKFSFYNQLNVSNQNRFLYRVMVFQKINKIKVHDDIKHVSEDIDLLVCAAFAQITFGYTDFTISSFSKILIYPDSFYSKLANANVNGLTVGNGFIYLSWNHFLRGYQNREDRINLALHELAHALYIDRFHYKRDFNWFLWEEKASPVFKQINNNGEIDFFRDYAKTNMAEFWAVCVECFFEDPNNFNKEFPELYQATAKVLYQNMLALN